MYFLDKKKFKRRKVMKVKEKAFFTNLFGIKLNSHNNYFKINGVEVKNILVSDKVLAHPLVICQVSKKYKTLIDKLTILLTSDDDSGECFREALNQIEKFRLIIKNKYRFYLKQNELKVMSNQLKLLQKEAKNKYEELQFSYEQQVNSSGKGR